MKLVFGGLLRRPLVFGDGGERLDQSFWEETYLNDPSEAMITDRLLAIEVDGWPIGSALDLGCGSGANALTLAERGWSVLGVDWSPSAIRYARESARTNGVPARFEIADFTIWEPTEEFELVYSTYSLPGGDATTRVLRTASRALAPDGTLLIAEWDQSMAAEWGMGKDELASVEQVVSALDELIIERAEILRVNNPFGPENPGNAKVVFVRARRLSHEQSRLS